MTLFPDAIDAMMGQSIIGRAQARGLVTITAHQIREYTTNKQMQVDDYPYRGGRGAVHAGGPTVPLLGPYLSGGRGSGYTPSIFPPAGGCLTSRWPRS